MFTVCTEHMKIVYSQAIARIAASMGKGVSPCTWKHCSRCLSVFTFFCSTQQCNDARLTVVWHTDSLMLPFPLHVSQVTAWNFENGHVHYYQQILKYREYAKIMATAVHASDDGSPSNGCCTTTRSYSASCSPSSCSQTTQRYATATTSGYRSLL